MHSGLGVIQTWYSLDHLDIVTTTQGINNTGQMNDYTIGIIWKGCKGFCIL